MKKSCLIVEPNRVIRTVMRAIMQDLRFECMQANDAAAALTIMRDDAADVVLAEWDLADGTGLDMLKSIRALPLETQPIVIFCAAQNDPELLKSALAAGANDFIMKPFDAAIVRSKLAMAGMPI